MEIPWEGRGAEITRSLIRLALEEDGPDATSNALFALDANCAATLVAKEDTLVAGLPVMEMVFHGIDVLDREKGRTAMPPAHWEILAEEGASVPAGTALAKLWGNPALLFRAERVILNIVCHTCGIANLTAKYVKELEGTHVTLLDTRKTMAGHRSLEKYAVRIAGGKNHRFSLLDMLMLKDNHIDAAGSITAAITELRNMYADCLPITVECRTKAEVEEAVACKPTRILLDNMSTALLAEVLPLIPKVQAAGTQQQEGQEGIEAEISGGINLENIRAYALSCKERPADFISVGRITHSAPVADLSMVFAR